MPNATKKSKQLSGHFLSDFAVLCSCILYHPLYLSYFLFFSPYLLKLLAFLSPLFITTTLLLTSILHESCSFSSLLESLQLRFDRIVDEEDESSELEGFEELELYTIVFGSFTFDLVSEYPYGETVSHVEFSREIEEKEEKVLGVLISDEGGFQVKFDENAVEFSGEIEGKICGIPIVDQLRENPDVEEEEKILGVLISDEWDFPAKGREKTDVFSGKRQDDDKLDEVSRQETAECEKLTSGVEKEGGGNPTMTDKKYEEVLTIPNGNPLELTPSSINGGNHKSKRELIKTISRRHGEGVWNTNHSHSTSKKHDGDDDDDDSLSYSSSHSRPLSPSFSNLGSMRKEKEWRRTLACKLFEERHNVSGGGGGEGMDMLWEAYEKTEENNGKQSSKKKEKNKKKGRVADYALSYGNREEEVEEEDEVDNGQLCCLQALRFSAGKMNFGMGRPGFMKISKAFKGIGGGWLNHHNRHQHSGGSKKGKSS